VKLTKYENPIVISALAAVIGIGIGGYFNQEQVVVTAPVPIVKVEPTPLNPEQARLVAKKKLADYGWANKEQWKCLNWVWGKESAWNYQAVSPTKDHGIPQRNMPNHTTAEKINFLKDPVKQIEWGLGYIEHRYGSPCKAKLFKERNGWY
jgi:hypothetical protein